MQRNLSPTTAKATISACENDNEKGSPYTRATRTRQTPGEFEPQWDLGLGYLDIQNQPPREENTVSEAGWR